MGSEAKAAAEQQAPAAPFSSLIKIPEKNF